MSIPFFSVVFLIRQLFFCLRRNQSCFSTQTLLQTSKLQNVNTIEPNQPCSLFFTMFHQSLLQPCSFSFSSNPFHKTTKSSSFTFTLRCQAKDPSLSHSEVVYSPQQQPLSVLAMSKLMESENKNGPYPGGLGPFTGRDPNVKKPAWLRQKAPQGERFSQIKESISQLKLNTVCEEAQCPNIGEVLFSSFC